MKTPKKKPQRKSNKKGKSFAEESVHLAFGLASLASKKLNMIVGQLSKEGKNFQNDHEKTYQSLVKKGEKEYQKLIKKVSVTLKNSLDEGSKIVKKISQSKAKKMASKKPMKKPSAKKVASKKRIKKKS